MAYTSKETGKVATAWVSIAGVLALTVAAIFGPVWNPASERNAIRFARDQVSAMLLVPQTARTIAAPCKVSIDGQRYRVRLAVDCAEALNESELQWVDVNLVFSNGFTLDTIHYGEPNKPTNSLGRV